MAINEGARKDGEFIVVSILPDVCKTPPQPVPVAYQIVGKLADGIQESHHVNRRGSRL